MNGRLWITWDPNKVSIDFITYFSQIIHCTIAYPNGSDNIWCITIYASNKLGQRRLLWHEVDKLEQYVQGPWYQMRDFNNVLRTQDITGGNDAHESEFIDLGNMMGKTIFF